MEISGKGLLHFHQETSSLIGYHNNHRTNMFLPYQSNSYYESDYECICIVVNGKTRGVPLNILTGFKNATLTSCHIFKKTVKCKRSLL